MGCILSLLDILRKRYSKKPPESFDNPLFLLDKVSSQTQTEENVFTDNLYEEIEEHHLFNFSYEDTNSEEDDFEIIKKIMRKDYKNS